MPGANTRERKKPHSAWLPAISANECSCAKEMPRRFTASRPTMYSRLDPSLSVRYPDGICMSAYTAVEIAASAPASLKVTPTSSRMSGRNNERPPKVRDWLLGASISSAPLSQSEPLPVVLIDPGAAAATEAAPGWSMAASAVAEAAFCSVVRSKGRFSVNGGVRPAGRPSAAARARRGRTRRSRSACGRSGRGSQRCARSARTDRGQPYWRYSGRP